MLLCFYALCCKPCLDGIYLIELGYWMLLFVCCKTFDATYFVQGPPGTGKTTSILALAHELLGSNCKEGVLELNASDDRYSYCPPLGHSVLFTRSLKVYFAC